MTNKERKLLHLEIKAIDDTAGTIEGYGSVKGAIDSYGDQIVDGAYNNLDEFIKSGFLAEGHDWDCAPIGFILDAKEDSAGLWFKAQFHSTDEAQKCRTVVQERMKAGKDVGLSIGYFTRDYAYEQQNGASVRVLKKIDVKEISIVTVPAMPLALAAAVKGGGISFADQVEGVLAALDDLVGRCETFAGERKQGLTAPKLETLAAIKTRVQALLDHSDTEQDGEDVEAVVDDADIKAMMAFRASLD